MCFRLYVQSTGEEYIPISNDGWKVIQQDYKKVEDVVVNSPEYATRMVVKTAKSVDRFMDNCPVCNVGVTVVTFNTTGYAKVGVKLFDIAVNVEEKLEAANGFIEKVTGQKSETVDDIKDEMDDSMMGKRDLKGCIIIPSRRTRGIRNRD